MNIVIYGAGSLGRYIINEIKSNPTSGISVKCTIDNEKCGDSNTNIISFDEYLNRVDDTTIIVAIRNTIVAQSVVLDLLENGIENILLPFPQMLEAKLDVISHCGGLSSFFLPWRDQKPILPYLEYQVADECNLRCKACMHFSNLISGPQHAPLDDFEQSLISLSKSFFNIEKIRLMGGEPLLNPNLKDFIRVSRGIFPLADIRVVTNGTMISDISRDLIDVMRECVACFDITQYTPIRTHLKSLVEFLDNCHIRYYLGEQINEFIVRMSKGEEDPYDVFYNSCLSKTCTFLRNKRIYACPHIPMLFEQREYFGYEIDKSEFGENGIDILCKGGWEILKQLRNPNSMCRFCSPNPKRVAWKTGKADREDWIV